MLKPLQSVAKVSPTSLTIDAMVTHFNKVAEGTQIPFIYSLFSLVGAQPAKGYSPGGDTGGASATFPFPVMPAMI